LNGRKRTSDRKPFRAKIEAYNLALDAHARSHKTRHDAGSAGKVQHAFARLWSGQFDKIRSPGREHCRHKKILVLLIGIPVKMPLLSLNQKGLLRSNLAGLIKHIGALLNWRILLAN
jgi:hypothetical protein